jgi:hypothetical protein
MSSYYSDWYQANKQRLSEKRKKKYAEDPEYREKAIGRARGYRQMTGGFDGRPPQYSIDSKTAAEMLEVSPYTLLTWRKKQYYPAPANFSNKFYFTERQVDLLRQLREFLYKYSYRVPASAQGEMDTILQIVQLNW